MLMILLQKLVMKQEAKCPCVHRSLAEQELYQYRNTDIPAKIPEEICQGFVQQK